MHRQGQLQDQTHQLTKQATFQCLEANLVLELRESSLLGNSLCQHLHFNQSLISSLGTLTKLLSVLFLAILQAIVIALSLEQTAPDRSSHRYSTYEVYLTILFLSKYTLLNITFLNLSIPIMHVHMEFIYTHNINC